MESQGKVAVVTGGARGIGRATAEALSREGYTLALADRDLAAAQEAAAEMSAAGRTVMAVEADVADRAGVERMAQAILDSHGRIDVLVNNAGIAGRAAPLLEVKESEWDEMMAVDLKSIYLCCRAVLTGMIERGSGAIINVASIAGKEGNPNMIPYSTAKAGVIGFTKALAKEVAGQGIRVNAVAPAVIETGILRQLTPEQVEYMKTRVPLGRLGQPEEVAAVIAFLASEKASFVTGQCYDVSGGRATY
ncbi:MAG: 3-oxoacyl-ACP reductase FabG [Armatimonadetes bacterium]|nr:3-oxoacyl-ACP reductase FabG [Armatimonadota bacterium]